MKERKALLDKYWKGETDADEENRLKKEFSEAENSPDADFFRFLKEKTGETIGDEIFDQKVLSAIRKPYRSKRGLRVLMNWRVAAAIVLLVTAVLAFRYGTPNETPSAPTEVLADTYEDPEKAFEETKKALMFLSAKLNEGSSYTRELGKFSESQEKLKNE